MPVKPANAELCVRRRSSLGSAQWAWAVSAVKLEGTSPNALHCGGSKALSDGAHDHDQKHDPVDLLAAHHGVVPKEAKNDLQGSCFVNKHGIQTQQLCKELANQGEQLLDSMPVLFLRHDEILTVKEQLCMSSPAQRGPQQARRQ